MTVPVPDTKDWTFVIDDGCAECGFEPRFDRADLPDRIQANVAAWLDVLRGTGVSRRPAPAVWSPLEYGCHVRDVLRLYDYRLGLMLREDDPLYPNWDQDETAIAENYAAQDPGTVGAELRQAGHTVAASFTGLSDEQWQRRGRRSDGKSFTVERFGRYFLHDIEHHLYDVIQQPPAAIPPYPPTAGTV